MSTDTIRYAQLSNYLASVGYSARQAPTHVVYSKSGARLPIVLPKTFRTEEVSPFHLAAIGRILELDGVIGRGRLLPSIKHATAKHRATKAKGKNTFARKVAASDTKAARRKSAHANAGAETLATLVRLSNLDPVPKADDSKSHVRMKSRKTAVARVKTKTME